MTTLLLSLCLIASFFCGAPDAWAVHPTNLEPWQLFSSLFLHANVDHLGNNLLGLVCAGALFERRHGPLAMLLFFLGSGALAGSVELLATTHTGLLLGSSGAVYALMGAFASEGRRAIPAILLVAGYLLWPFYVGVDAIPQLAHYAHAAGFCCGLLWALLTKNAGLHSALPTTHGLSPSARHAQPTPADPLPGRAV